MKLKPHILSLLFLAITTLSLEGAAQPNFVFIQGEAVGWSALSTPLSPNHPAGKNTSYYTPNLEKLANEGMRFSNFYAPSPRCTPSRVAYFTGQSPAQLRITFISREDSGGRVLMPNSTTSLSPRESNLASILKTKNYATAHFGKWHMGRTSPSQYGYDEHDGANGNAGPENSQNPNPKQLYATTAKGIDFMKRSAAENKPFFLAISHYAGRSAMHVRPESMEFMKQRNGSRNLALLGHAAAVYEADRSIGMIINALDQMKIRGNTHIFFTADHGSQGSNSPLNRGKGSVKEGGIRVPLIWSGPGVQSGRFTTVPTTGVDLLPTVAELAGVRNLSSKIEGGSLVPALIHGKNAPVKRRFDELVFHYPHYDRDPYGPATAILHDDHKLIHYYETNRKELYDLSSDMSERTNIASQNPERVQDLSQRLTTYLKKVNAEIPTIDPSRPLNAGSAPRAGFGSKEPREGRDRKPNRSALFGELDADGNGSLSPKETSALPALLKSMDTNKDGSINTEEFPRPQRKQR